MAKTIYISGAITGQHPDLVKKVFSEAEYMLILLGYKVVNPLTLNHQHDQSWEEYMAVDIKALFKCDAIYMLSNWHNSRGAKIERAVAKAMGIEIIYEASKSRVWWLKRMMLTFSSKEVSHA
jgi:hypothetical protein